MAMNEPSESCLRLDLIAASFSQVRNPTSRVAAPQLSTNVCHANEHRYISADRKMANGLMPSSSASVEIGRPRTRALEDYRPSRTVSWTRRRESRALLCGIF